MSPDAFTTVSPGRLLPTLFRELLPSGKARVVEGYGFVPDCLPPKLELSELLMAQHDAVVKAERALSHLEGIASKLENPGMLIGPLQQREARLSSAIEDTKASAQQMAMFMVDPTTIDRPSRDEVKEVTNYVRALHTGFKSELPICLRLVKELHSILLGGIERAAGTPGEFRTTQNAIGKAGESFASARYVPPPPAELDRLLKDWERFINETESRIPRLIRFAIAHYQFESIHPFDDGNGRIGRLLISLQLCEQAQLSRPLVYVSGYFEKHRSRYYDLMYEVSTQGRWMEWIGFFLDAVAEQAGDTAERSGRLIALRERYHGAVREKRASGLLPGLVDRLFYSPSLTIADVRAQTGVTPQAASGLVKRLEEKNIVIEVTGRASHRVWVAGEILDVIGE